MNLYSRSLCFVALSLVAAPAIAQTVDPKLYAGMKWRSIGPYRGGRSLAVAGSVQRPKEYFFGANGGGVWKTTDGGTTWDPVSDGFLGTSSVGALAVAPSNPDIVVAGTGERDIRGDISHGDGVYRSTDAGKTWTKIGLEATQTVSRIVIDPNDPNKMFVAALGHVYGRGGERGVYRTTDAGKSWTRVLNGTDRAGAVDLAMDSQHPNVLLAATWEAWRTPYSLNSGGSGSGLWKTTDGGTTWQDLSRNPGMPSGVLGKIGVSISPVDPNRYWANIEAAEGGIFRSDDAGATWTKVNDSRNWRQRAWYYTHIYADPKDKEAFYVLNVGAARSKDGGKTFSAINPPHGDNHDLWIAPNDPTRMIEANDGGASVSTDGGRNWTPLTFPTAQFYHVVTDNAFPYRILGAQQDNSTVRIPSRTPGFGIGREDWTTTAGGESGYIAPKPDNPDIVYGGSYGGDLSMLNHATNQFRSVDPWPDNPMGHGAIDLEHRFQWTYPIVFSPHNANTLYTCSQYVLKTTNGGQSWKKISPDLTRNDPSTLQSSGGPITKDNTSVEYYGTVFTLAESPKRRGVIWAGSDDGLIHVTQDGGGHWANVTPRGMPKWGLVSMIEASPFDPAVAYAAVDNHENDDLAPYIYKTSDYGVTWKLAISGLPKDSYVRVVREDHKRPGLLYAGTETGVWVSFDNGGRWQTLQMNLPNTPIHDLAWKEDDLIAATHGRSFWVLDDVTPLQQLAGKGTTENRFFAPKDAYAVSWGGSPSGSGANPLSGVVLSYFLAAPAKDVKVEIADAKGTLLTTVSGDGGVGFHRTSASFQYKSWHGFSGMILWAGFPGPIAAPPGEYTATLVVDGVRQSARFKWLKDPRLPASDRDLVEQFTFLQRIAARLNEANDAVVQIRGVREALDKALADSTKGTSDAVLAASVAKVQLGLTQVEEAIYQTKNRSGQDPLNYPIRLNDRLAGVFSNVSGGKAKPTDQSYEVFGRLSKLLQVELDKLGKLFGPELKSLNDEFAKHGVAAVTVPKVIPTETPRRRGGGEEED